MMMMMMMMIMKEDEDEDDYCDCLGKGMIIRVESD